MLRLPVGMARPGSIAAAELRGKTRLFRGNGGMVAQDWPASSGIERRPPVPRSVLDPDLRLLDHRAPFIGLGFQEGGELRRRRAFRVGAEILESRLDRR